MLERERHEREEYGRTTSLQAKTVLAELRRRHPEQFPKKQLRTLQQGLTGQTRCFPLDREHLEVALHLLQLVRHRRSDDLPRALALLHVVSETGTRTFWAKACRTFQ